jgi:hypothetical protein
LKALGFEDSLIEENKRLGLKERQMERQVTMKAYLARFEEEKKEA